VNNVKLGTLGFLAWSCNGEIARGREMGRAPTYIWVRPCKVLNNLWFCKSMTSTKQKVKYDPNPDQICKEHIYDSWQKNKNHNLYNYSDFRPLTKFPTKITTVQEPLHKQRKSQNILGANPSYISVHLPQHTKSHLFLKKNKSKKKYKTKNLKSHWTSSNLKMKNGSIRSGKRTQDPPGRFFCWIQPHPVFPGSGPGPGVRGPACLPVVVWVYPYLKPLGWVLAPGPRSETQARQHWF
jgi:hypothetical protein